MHRRTFLKSSLALATSSLAAQAASGADTTSQPARTRPEWDAQTHTDALFENIPQRLAYREGLDVREWQSRLRARVRELLGVTHLEQEVRFEHRAEQAESVHLDGYTREKWYLYTEPNVPLPIWVLIPDRPARQPWPLVLAVHGH